MKQGSSKFEVIALLLQAAILICFAVGVEYEKDTALREPETSAGEAQKYMAKAYPFFQDVHVMVFIGFGFLMCFLKTHSWTSVGYNFLIAVFSIQLAILWGGLWKQVVAGHAVEKIQITLDSLIVGDFGAATVLITFGAILGRCSVEQLFLIAFLEIPFWALNEAICVEKFHANDMGGSMYVHTFGAYFGVAVSLGGFTKASRANKYEASSDRISNLLAALGTVFLWMYWPSFNGALSAGSTQQRVVINTVIALCTCCLSSVIFSRLVRGKVDIEVLLNATLAGGVAIGTASDIVAEPWVSMLIGAIAGVISAFGFIYLGPFLQEKIGLYDTCGVNNLHGMPGIIGGSVGAFLIPDIDSRIDKTSFHHFVEDGSLGKQYSYQFYALLTTLAISLGSGFIVGWLASSKLFNPPKVFFHDKEHFEDVDEDPVPVQQVAEEQKEADVGFKDLQTHKVLEAEEVEVQQKGPKEMYTLGSDSFFYKKAMEMEVPEER